MVDGKAVVVFGDDTTLMIPGVCTDNPWVALNFCTRSPGPVRDDELPSEEDVLTQDDYPVQLVFKRVENVDKLIGMLSCVKEALHHIKEKDAINKGLIEGKCTTCRNLDTTDFSCGQDCNNGDKYESSVEDIVENG